MEKKIGIQELAAALAKAKEIDGSEAEIFCRSVFDVISEFVLKDKLVKVKGVGTFKLIDVSDRESINVNTGERIVIAGHTKMSFTPDSTLRDIVNRPFADFETTILSENASTEKMELIPSGEPQAGEPQAGEPQAEESQAEESQAEESQMIVPSVATELEGKEPREEELHSQELEVSGLSSQESEKDELQSDKPHNMGAEVDEPDTKDTDPERQTVRHPRRSRTWIYILFIVIAAVCAIFYAIRKNAAEKAALVAAKQAEIDKHIADSIASRTADSIATVRAIEQAKADSIAKAKADSDSIAKINQAVMEYYEKHPEQRWRLEQALRRSRARARHRD